MANLPGLMGLGWVTAVTAIVGAFHICLSLNGQSLDASREGSSESLSWVERRMGKGDRLLHASSRQDSGRAIPGHRHEGSARVFIPPSVERVIELPLGKLPRW